MSTHRLRLVGTTLAVATLAAACGTGGATSSGSGGSASGPLTGGPGIDVASKTISVGILSPLSGPVQVIGQPLTSGQEAWFQHVNDNGGLNGWKINFKDNEKDDGYNPTKHTQLYDAIQPNIAMLAQSLGSPTTKAIQAQLDSDNMVYGAAAQDSEFVSDVHAAVIGTPYAADTANGVSYIVNKLGKTNARIAVISQNDAYGQDGLKGIHAGLQAAGLTSVDEETYNASDKDFTAQVLKLKAANPDYVFVVATPSPAGTIVGTAAASKFFPQWVFQGPAWSEYLMTKDGTAQGTHGPLYSILPTKTWVLGYEASWGDTSVPGMQQFLADQAKYFPNQAPDGYFIYGYCMAQVETAILAKAIQNNDLSRAGILNAKENLGQFDFGGLIPSLTYTPTAGAADRQTDISQVDTASPAFLKTIEPYFESDAAKNLQLGG